MNKVQGNKLNDGHLESQSWTVKGTKELQGQKIWVKYPRKCRKGCLCGTEMREEEYVGRAMVMDASVKRIKGRPQRRWTDSIKRDSRAKGISGEEA